MRGLFEGWHLVILLVLIIALFGAKRLPDAARSLGRSARVFKSEVDDRKKDAKSTAASATVPGETVQPGQSAAPAQPAPPQSAPPAPASPIQENAPRTDNTSGAA